MKSKQDIEKRLLQLENEYDCLMDKIECSMDTVEHDDLFNNIELVENSIDVLKWVIVD